MQAYPGSKNMKEVEAFVVIWGGGLFPPHALLPSLIPPCKERAHRGSGQQAVFEQAKILVKQN